MQELIDHILEELKPKEKIIVSIQLIYMKINTDKNETLVINSRIYMKGPEFQMDYPYIREVSYQCAQPVLINEFILYKNLFRRVDIYNNISIFLVGYP